MKYQSEYSEDSSYGSAVRLVARAGVGGVVLDLGCGFGPVAEPLRALGVEYVGLDIDEVALGNLAERGFETSPLDLDQASRELEAQLAAALAGRRLGAVLVLDALEHVRDPDAVVAAVTALAGAHTEAQLVVSLPNVTHLDLAAKLLLGRWEMMTTGLLDRTHLHFFDERRATDLVTAHGWAPVDADDVTLWPSEQCTPADAPHLRPGAPLSDALDAVRRRADPHGRTYQFVRRYQLADAPAESAPASGGSPFLAVVLDDESRADDTLRAALEAQRDRDVVVLAPAGPDALPWPGGLPNVAVEDGDVLAALAASGARYVAVLGSGTVPGHGWVEDVRRLVDVAPGRVIVAGCADTTLEGAPIEVATLEVLGAELAGWVIPAAYALPAAALLDGGLGRLGPTVDDLVTSAARCVAWCGRADSHEVTMAARPERRWVDVVTAVAAALDEEPTIHAAGGLAPSVAQVRELMALRAENSVLRQRVDALSAARDAEVAELHARVARQSTPWGALSFAGERWARAALRRLRASHRGSAR